MSKLLTNLRNAWKESSQNIAIQEAHEIQDLIDKLPNWLLGEAKSGSSRCALNLPGYPRQTWMKVKDWAEANSLQWEGDESDRVIVLFGWAQ